MCLAVPAQIISLDGTLAVAEMSGVKKQIDVTLTPEVVPGDWVVVHVGYALQRIDPEKAQETLARCAPPAIWVPTPWRRLDLGRLCNAVHRRISQQR